MSDAITRFPLFPLGLVLLPTEVVPLHIFEERYKTMVSECIEEEREFGIVWMSDAGLRDVGCTAEIAEVLERTEDGRSNILVHGSRPFRLVRRIDDMEYPAGDIELLEEPGDEDVEAEVAEEARERYADLVARVTDTRPEQAELAELDSYRMAATVDFEPDLKQSLLEQRSEEGRLRMVAEMLTAAMKRIDYAERAGDVARSNGKVRS